MSTFKLLFLLGSFCISMWQLPNIIGVVDGAKSGNMSQMLQLLGGAGPNTAGAAEQDPERLNDLLGELGMPAVGALEGMSESGSGPPILITPDDSMTPEEARALVDQQRREAMERSGQRNPS